MDWSCSTTFIIHYLFFCTFNTFDVCVCACVRACLMAGWCSGCGCHQLHNILAVLTFVCFFSWLIFLFSFHFTYFTYNYLLSRFCCKGQQRSSVHISFVKAGAHSLCSSKGGLMVSFSFWLTQSTAYDVCILNILQTETGFPDFKGGLGTYFFRSLSLWREPLTFSLIYMEKTEPSLKVRLAWGSSEMERSAFLVILLI